MKLEMTMKKFWLLLIGLLFLYGCSNVNNVITINENGYKYREALYTPMGIICLSEEEMQYVAYASQVTGKEKQEVINYLQSLPTESICGYGYKKEDFNEFSKKTFCLYQYAEWLLVGWGDDKFILFTEDSILQDNTEFAPDDTEENSLPPFIFWDNNLYVYQGSDTVGLPVDNLTEIGFVRDSVKVSLVPREELQTNIASLIGHMVFEHEGKLYVSWSGGERYNIYAGTENLER